jgi:hypothetical protein
LITVDLKFFFNQPIDHFIKFAKSHPAFSLLFKHVTTAAEKKIDLTKSHVLIHLEKSSDVPLSSASPKVKTIKEKLAEQKKQKEENKEKEEMVPNSVNL